MGRDKPRPRRVVGPVVVLAALSAVTALLGASEQPSWLAWSPRWMSVALVAVLGVLGVWWTQPWAARRRSDADLEWQAATRLRRYLGRRRGLLRVGQGSGRALALRVHPATPLSGHRADQASGDEVVPPAKVVGRRRRWTVPLLEGRVVDRRLDPDLPLWVERERSREVCAALGAAAERGGFLLLVGNSSVGKTRLLYEAVERVLPGWAILAPDLGDGDLVNVLAEATFR